MFLFKIICYLIIHQFLITIFILTIIILFIVIYFDLIIILHYNIVPNYIFLFRNQVNPDYFNLNLNSKILVQKIIVDKFFLQLF